MCTAFKWGGGEYNRSNSPAKNDNALQRYNCLLKNSCAIYFKYTKK